MLSGCIDKGPYPDAKRVVAFLLALYFRLLLDYICNGRGLSMPAGAHHLVYRGHTVGYRTNIKNRGVYFLPFPSKNFGGCLVRFLVLFP